MRRNSTSLDTLIRRPTHKLSNVDFLSRKEPYQRKAGYHERKGVPRRFSGRQFTVITPGKRMSQGFTDFRYNQDLVNNDYQHQYIKERVKVLNRIDDTYQENLAAKQIKLPKIESPWDRQEKVKVSRRRSVVSGYADNSAIIQPYLRGDRLTSRTYTEAVSHANPEMTTPVHLPPISKPKNNVAIKTYNEPWLD